MALQCTNYQSNAPTQTNTQRDPCNGIPRVAGQTSIKGFSGGVIAGCVVAPDSLVNSGLRDALLLSELKFGDTDVTRTRTYFSTWVNQYAPVFAALIPQLGQRQPVRVRKCRSLVQRSHGFLRNPAFVLPNKAVALFGGFWDVADRVRSWNTEQPRFVYGPRTCRVALNRGPILSIVGELYKEHGGSTVCTGLRIARLQRYLVHLNGFAKAVRQPGGERPCRGAG